MTTALFLIKLAAALIMIIFGIDQIVNPKNWIHYLPTWFGERYPIKRENVMRIQGIGNLVLAVFLVSGIFPFVAAWLVFAWWIATLPFAFMHDWRLGMRDLVVTICILAMIYLIA